MFNKDYDVLYQMVKDQPIENGETFGQRLARYADSENDLADIERQVPSLTIFIPSLPSGFSAETWNVANEVPVIAVRKLDDGKVPFYDDKGIESVMQPYETPGFPVLVIKQNERVRVTAAGAAVGKGDQLPFYQNQQFSFSFSSPVYDGIHQSSHMASRRAQGPEYYSMPKERLIGRPVTSYRPMNLPKRIPICGNGTTSIMAFRRPTTEAS